MALIGPHRVGITLCILGEHLLDERIEAQKVSVWRRQNKTVRLRVGGDFLLSLCLVVLRGQSWRRPWGRQAEAMERPIGAQEGGVAWCRTYVNGRREEADNGIFRSPQRHPL